MKFKVESHACRQAGLKLKVKHGFTLIELLVVITMMIMVVVAITGAMMGTFRAQTRVNLSNKADQNGNFALTEIKKNILNAISNTITCSSDKTSVSFSSVIDGQQTTFVCYPPSGSNKGKIASESARPTVDLTSTNEVSVISCNNFVVCNTDGNGVITSLDFNFKLKVGTTQPNYLERDFSLKVSARN